MLIAWKIVHSKGKNGYVKNKADWKERRAELSDLLQYYYYGYQMKTHRRDVAYSGDFGMNNATLTVTVNNPENGKSGSCNATGIYVPTYKEGAKTPI